LVVCAATTIAIATKHFIELSILVPPRSTASVHKAVGHHTVITE